MHNTDRRMLANFIGLMLAVITIAGCCLFLVISNETVRQKLAALPRYAQTYASQLRPKPALPTPPAVSAVDAASLLQNTDAAASTGANAPAYTDELLDTAEGAEPPTGGIAGGRSEERV